MAIFGIMSVAASGASASRKKVRLPGCEPFCGNTAGAWLKLEAGGEELNCFVVLWTTFTENGHFTINLVTILPSEPLCEVVEIFEETLPWHGKLCEESVTGQIEIPVEEVAFFAPLGSGTFEGALNAIGRTRVGGRQLFAADLNKAEIGTSEGVLTGSFELGEDIHIQPSRSVAC
jgi:hypothetical protein